MHKRRCSTLLFISKSKSKPWKRLQIKMLETVWRKWNSPMLLVGMCVGAAIMEDIMEITQKTKNRVAIQSINSTPGRISRQNSNSKSYMHHYVHSNTIHNSKTGKNLCSLAEEWRQMFHTHPYIWNITGIYIIYMEYYWNIYYIYVEYYWATEYYSAMKNNEIVPFSAT